MSTKAFNGKNNKAKKGISPVIATVILVAVAVVIAAALAGFSSSLFGAYSQNSQVTIRSVELQADGTGTMTMVNKGGSPETVANVAVTGFTPTDPIDYTQAGAVVGKENVIQANGEATIGFASVDDQTTPARHLTTGQTVTLTITTQSGQAYTISTIVQ